MFLLITLTILAAYNANATIEWDHSIIDTSQANSTQSAVQFSSRINEHLYPTLALRQRENHPYSSALSIATSHDPLHDIYRVVVRKKNPGGSRLSKIAMVEVLSSRNACRAFCTIQFSHYTTESKDKLQQTFETTYEYNYMQCIKSPMSLEVLPDDQNFAVVKFNLPGALNDPAHQRSISLGLDLNNFPQFNICLHTLEPLAATNEDYSVENTMYYAQYNGDNHCIPRMISAV